MMQSLKGRVVLIASIAHLVGMAGAVVILLYVMAILHWTDGMSYDKLTNGGKLWLIISATLVLSIMGDPIQKLRDKYPLNPKSQPTKENV